jgi:Cdc6-like AAA superfamily ATPase
MILETSINGWNNKIVQHKQITYPQTLDENTPKNFFLAIFCGSRGSGKTYLLSKLLKH